MDRILRTGLVERGWAVHEADRVAQLSEEQPLGNKVFEGVVFYAILGVCIAANFIVSLVLIPILMVLTEAYLIFALFFVGLAFGALIETLIKETSRYHASKLLIPELFIPSVALINIYIATQLANRVAVMLLLPTGIQNPFLTSIVYVTAFMIPHFVRKLHRQKIARRQVLET